MKDNLVLETGEAVNFIIDKLTYNRNTLMLIDFKDNTTIKLDDKAFNILKEHYKKKKRINKINLFKNGE